MNLIILADFLQKIIFATLVGAIVGMEREYSQRHGTAGLRTFALISMIGCLAVIISTELIKDTLLITIGFAFTALLAAINFYKGSKKKKPVGFTTGVALILIYTLGVLVGYNLFMESIAISIIISILLFSKEKMHELVEHLTRKELGDVLSFLVILGIIYPLIPQEVTLYGLTLPLFTMWLMVVTISLINFAAFISSRYLSSKKEIEAISFLGGFVSSSATLIEILELYKKNKKTLQIMGGGFLLLNAASFIRNTLIVSLSAPDAIIYMAVPGLVCAGTMIFFGFRKVEEKKMAPKLVIESPFNVLQGVKLAAAIMIMYVALSFISEINNSEYILALSFIGGFVETSAMLISLVSLHAQGSIDAVTLAVSAITAQMGGYLANILLCYALKGRKVFKESMVQFAVAVILSFLSLFILIALV